MAGKHLITRQRIEASSAQSAQELLQREPGITVGANGRLGLLGLPGYTQILVDGQPPTAGYGPSELTLDRIERIEVIKSAQAETGPFAIAGTINIVTRMVRKAAVHEARANTTFGPDTQKEALRWSRSGELLPDRLRLRLSADVAHKQDRSNVTSTWVGANPFPGEHRHSRNITDYLFLDSELEFAPAPTEQIKLGVSVVRFWNRNRDGWRSTGGNLEQVEGNLAVDSRSRWLTISPAWSFEDSNENQWSLKGSSSRNVDELSAQQRVLPSTDPRQLAQSRWQDRTLDFLTLNLTPALPERHTLKLGAEFKRATESSRFEQLTNGIPDLSLASYGDQSDRSINSRSAFAQHDWRVDSSFAVNAGLRYVATQGRVIEGAYSARPGWHVWAPSGHVAWKLDDTGDSRLRISLARSFKAPDNDELGNRPRIDSESLCRRIDDCPTNRPDHPDLVGNPALKPERALGLTASFEQDWGPRSQFTLDLFARQLNAVIGNDLTLRSVAWSTDLRYVQTPANFGRAWTRGFDLGASAPFRIDSESWAPFNVSVGLSLARSRLLRLPAPDNHLAEQRPWSLKVGLDYKTKSLPLDWNINFSSQPGSWTRVSATQRTFMPRDTDLSVDMAWAFSKELKVRFGLRKLTARTQTARDVFYSPDGALEQQIAKTPYPSAVFRIEAKL